MEYEFTKQFIKDTRRLQKDAELIHLLGAKINETAKAKKMNNINGLCLIRGTKVHYRFKIKTKSSIYRIGIKKLKNTIWFACIENDKKRFYKRFP